MDTTDDDWAVAQSWIGTKETREVFDERFDRLGSRDLAVQESLRAQLAVLTGNPASFSLPSGLSVSQGENIRALREQLTKITDLIGAGPTGVVVNKLVRRRGR